MLNTGNDFTQATGCDVLTNTTVARTPSFWYLDRETRGSSKRQRIQAVKPTGQWRKDDCALPTKHRNQHDSTRAYKDAGFAVNKVSFVRWPELL